MTREGEILIRGRTLFAGYVNRSALELPLDKDGWFHTGDLGEMDEDGNLFILGRRDNMFISGGENIQPEEIERVVAETQLVEEVVVVPLEDPEFGHCPVAFVRWKRTAPVVHRERLLMASLEKRLPRFKLPKMIYPMPEKASAGAIKPSRAMLVSLALELQALPKVD